MAREPRAAVLLAPACALGVCALAAAPATFAQVAAPAAAPAVLAGRLEPELRARLAGLERAQGVLFGALVRGDGRVDEADLLDRMARRLADAGASDDAEASAGFAALGPKAAGVLQRAHAFHREVVARYAAVPATARRPALDQLVLDYRGGSAVHLPDVPKDMTILYDHPYTSFLAPQPPETEPRRELRYPKLTGFFWSAHWYELAILEALESDDGAERGRAVGVVADRLTRKLSGGVPPDGYPTELPLAPAIAPGLVSLSARAASIVDNLNIMTDVLLDTLMHTGVRDRQRAIDEVLREFTDRQYRCVQDDEWIVVALRHSIFDQGGFALAPMPRYERNAAYGGHGQHYAVKRTPPACDAQ